MPVAVTSISLILQVIRSMHSLPITCIDMLNLSDRCTEVEVTVRESTATDCQRPPHLIIYDPPPPYPGPPIASTNPVQPRPSDVQQQHELRDSITNEPLFAFNRYGQMIPAQQVMTVDTRRQSVVNVNRIH